jgi:hypothetical protein
MRQINRSKLLGKATKRYEVRRPKTVGTKKFGSAKKSGKKSEQTQLVDGKAARSGAEVMIQTPPKNLTPTTHRRRTLKPLSLLQRLNLLRPNRPRSPKHPITRKPADLLLVVAALAVINIPETGILTQTSPIPLCVHVLIPVMPTKAQATLAKETATTTAGVLTPTTGNPQNRVT